MKKLFLDDVRKPYDPTWDVVRTYDAFVAYVNEHGCPDVVSFDHDLAFDHYPIGEQISEYRTLDEARKINYDAYEEKTGYHAAKWMIESGHIPAVVIVHSMNIAGTENIVALFKGLRCQVFRRKYDPTNPVKILEG